MATACYSQLGFGFQLSLARNTCRTSPSPIGEDFVDIEPGAGSEGQLVWILRADWRRAQPIGPA